MYCLEVCSCFACFLESSPVLRPAILRKRTSPVQRLDVELGHARLASRVRTLSSRVRNAQNTHAPNLGTRIPAYEQPTNSPHRRMRPNVRSHHRLTTVHQEDHISTTPARQRHTQGRNCRNTCLDTEMPHARRVGEEEAAVIWMGVDES